MKPGAKTLYPTNFPEHSLAALPYAIALSRQFQAELSCLHVIDEGNEEFLRSKCITPLVAAPCAMETAIYAATEQQFRKFIQTHLSEAENLKTELARGRPFVVLIKYARQHDIDLIVLGTHGRSAPSVVLLGSVAKGVVRKTPCLVLTVRHEKHKSEMPQERNAPSGRAVHGCSPLSVEQPTQYGNTVCHQSRSSQTCCVSGVAEFHAAEKHRIVSPGGLPGEHGIEGDRSLARHLHIG